MALRKVLEVVGAALDGADAVLDETSRRIGYAPEPSALADHVDANVQDVRSSIKEARLVVQSVLGPRERTLDLDAVRGGLGACHHLALEASEQLNDMLRGERVDDLFSIGRRDAEWRGWSRTVREDLERVRAALDRVQRAVLDAWLDVAERAAAGGVSVQATNIGQQLTVPAELAAEHAT